MDKKTKNAIRKELKRPFSKMPTIGRIYGSGSEDEINEAKKIILEELRYKPIPKMPKYQEIIDKNVSTEIQLEYLRKRPRLGYRPIDITNKQLPVGQNRFHHTDILVAMAIEAWWLENGSIPKAIDTQREIGLNKHFHKKFPVRQPYGSGHQALAWALQLPGVEAPKNLTAIQDIVLEDVIILFLINGIIPSITGSGATKVSSDVNESENSVLSWGKSDQKEIATNFCVGKVRALFKYNENLAPLVEKKFHELGLPMKNGLRRNLRNNVKKNSRDMREDFHLVPGTLFIPNDESELIFYYYYFFTNILGWTILSYRQTGIDSKVLGPEGNEYCVELKIDSKSFDKFETEHTDILVCWCDGADGATRRIIQERNILVIELSKLFRVGSNEPLAVGKAIIEIVCNSIGKKINIQ